MENENNHEDQQDLRIAALAERLARLEERNAAMMQQVVALEQSTSRQLGAMTEQLGQLLSLSSRWRGGFAAALLMGSVAAGVIAASQLAIAAWRAVKGL